MNATLEQIKPETIALIEAQAAHSGLSVDDYLRRLLSTGDQELTLKSEAKSQDLALKSNTKDDDFEADMIVFAEETENLPEYNGTYSREDIYFDHD